MTQIRRSNSSPKIELWFGLKLLVFLIFGAAFALAYYACLGWLVIKAVSMFVHLLLR